MKYWIADTNNSIPFLCWLYIIMPYDCPQVALEYQIKLKNESNKKKQNFHALILGFFYFIFLNF